MQRKCITKDDLFDRKNELSIYGFAIVLYKFKKKKSRNYCFAKDINALLHALALFFRCSVEFNQLNIFFYFNEHMFAIKLEKHKDKIHFIFIDSIAPDESNKFVLTKHMRDTINAVKKNLPDLIPKIIFLCNLTNQQTCFEKCGYYTAKNVSKGADIPNLGQTAMLRKKYETIEEGVHIIYYSLPERFMYLASSPDKISQYQVENKDAFSTTIHVNKEGDAESLFECLYRERFWHKKLVTPIRLSDRNTHASFVTKPLVIGYFHHKYRYFVERISKSCGDSEIDSMVWQMDANNLVLDENTKLLVVASQQKSVTESKSEFSLSSLDKQEKAADDDCNMITSEIDLTTDYFYLSF